MSDSDDKKRDSELPTASAAEDAASESARNAQQASLSDEQMQSLLRGALEDREPRGDLLRGVQAKLRQRSRGKFYDEGWSTAEHPPVYTYLLTAALMLAVLFVIYAVLMPTAGEPEPVTTEPAPVRVIPPRSK